MANADKSIIDSISDTLFGLGQKTVNLYDSFLTTDAKRVANSQRTVPNSFPIDQEEYYSDIKESQDKTLLYVGVGAGALVLLYFIYKKL